MHATRLKTFKNLITVWLVLLTVDLIIVRDITWTLEHYSFKRVLVNFVLTSLGLFGLLYLIKAYLLQGKIRVFIAYLVLLLPLLVQMSHFETYRKFVSAFGVKFFNEAPLMVLVFWVKHTNLIKIGVLALIVFWGISRLKQIRDYSSQLAVIASSLLFITVLMLVTFNWYSVPHFQQSIISFFGTMFEVAKGITHDSYKYEKPAVLENFEGEKPNIIYIIGESLTVSQMSIYGYQRKTTPNLLRLKKDKKLVALNNAVSIGTHTRLSVPYMLVGIGGIDPHGEIYSYPTIFNYAKARGYNTAFITSQDLSWGQMKTLLIDDDVDHFVDGLVFEKHVTVQIGADDMEVLQKAVLPYIKNAKSPFFLVVQMDGSHYPYDKHSQQIHKKFLPEERSNSINAYDNTVVKTDDYLNQLIHATQKYHPGTWLFYSTDHGQEIGANFGSLHDNFSEGVIHNAFLIVPPKGFYNQVALQTDAPVSQVDIVATILDIMGTEPIKPLDGYSLLKNIPADRLRICSKYMPTNHNQPETILMLPDMSYYYIDFSKMSVTFPDEKQSIPFEQWDRKFQEIFLKRLYSVPK